MEDQGEKHKPKCTLFQLWQSENNHKKAIAIYSYLYPPPPPRIACDEVVMSESSNRTLQRWEWGAEQRENRVVKLEEKVASAGRSGDLRVGDK